MTLLDASPPETAKPRIQWWVLTASAVVVFGLNLFWIGPWLQETYGQGAANLAYIGVRLVVLIALSYSLVRFAARSRYQAVSTTMVAAFFDQVIFKYILIQHELKVRPELWAGMTDLTPTAIGYGLATGFLFFAPFVLLLAFVGSEFTRLRSEWGRRG